MMRIFRKKTVLVLVSVLLLILVAAAASAAADGWEKEGSYLYYYKNAVKVTGLQTIDGKVYNFAANGALAGNGKVQQTGYGYVFPGSDNKLATGWKTVEGSKYYFWPDSCRAATPSLETQIGWQKPTVIDGISYLFGDDGKLVINDWWTQFSYVGPYFHSDGEGRTVYGYQKFNGYYYYFNEIGVSQSGFQIVNGEIHYFTENGHQPYEGFREAREWEKIDSAWHYFEPKTGAMRTNALDVNGYHYEFDNEGKLLISKTTILVINGKIYAIDTAGEYLKEWQTINGDTYYFNPEALTGLCNYWWLDGTYYFSDDGKMVTSKSVTVDDTVYYFGKDGKAESSKPAPSDKTLKYKFSGSKATVTGPADKSASNVTIPDTVILDGITYKVTEIKDSAFKGMKNLKTVSIGKNIKTIGKNAFKDCSSLTTVTGGKAVTTIKDSAFSGCKALTSFPSMSKLKTIEKSAFKKCSALPKITLGSSVASIGKDAFNGCKALNSITIKTKKLTADNVGPNAFKSTPKKATIKVPKDKVEEYKALLRSKGVNKKAKIKK